MLKRHWRSRQAINRRSAHAGTRRLCSGWANTYKRCSTRSPKATDSINVEVYIFSDDSVGPKFSAELSRRRQRVQVNMIYDQPSIEGTPRSLFDEMTEAGVQCSRSMVNPLSRAPLVAESSGPSQVRYSDGKMPFTAGSTFPVV